MSFEKQQQRCVWVASILGVAKVYQDDNCFVDEADLEGRTAAYITRNASEREVLVVGTREVAVPTEHYLGVV